MIQEDDKMIRKEELNLVTEWDKTFKKSDKVLPIKIELLFFPL